MNIFVLDADIERCAQYHCDAHVSKMILESVQIICTALNTQGVQTPYRSTHSKHPCVLWAGETPANRLWLAQLAKALNEEYRFRYRRDRDHASMQALDKIDGRYFAGGSLTEFAQAMPDQYKRPADVVGAYRAFYLGEKAGFARWTRRNPPEWWRNEEVVEPERITS